MTDQTLSSIPLPTIRRYPEYLSTLEILAQAGESWVSATRLGIELGYTPIAVRKDLAYSGLAGHSRRGFAVQPLIDSLRSALGWDNGSDAFLVGAGSLGKALLGYRGFEHYGLRIAAAFDNDPSLAGQQIGICKVLPVDKLVNLAQRMNVALGIISVPAPEAPAAANLLVEAGIRGIWNFAPVNLKVPHGVVVKREDLSLGLAVLSYRLREGEDK